MNTQPEALRLADLLQTNIWEGKCRQAERDEAAAELRRLHEENERNKTTIKEWLQANAPNGWINELRALNQELLEALKETTRCLAWHEEEHGVGMDQQVVKKSRAAIAKAEAT